MQSLVFFSSFFSFFFKLSSEGKVVELEGDKLNEWKLSLKEK